MHYITRFTKNHILMISGVVMVLLAFVGAQTMPKQGPDNVRQESVMVATSTSTSVIVVEETTTIPETTTTTEAPVVITTTTHYHPPVTATTKPYVATTIPQVKTSGSGGPPRNTTTLVGCIAFYESTWGDADPNVFQFVQGTWEAYGGTGSPGNASYATQEAIFWAAWEDAGEHHWLAQKGRCF